MSRREVHSVERELRFGTPLWLDKPGAPVPADPWPAHVSADVLVVGAGISGALVAESLTEAGRQVVIVDRRGPIRGSTPASTALLQYETDTPLSVLAKKIGRADAERAWRRSRLAVHALAERTRRLGIDAQLTSRDSLYLAGDRLDAKGLAREHRARTRAGFEGELLGRERLHERFGIRRGAALLSYGDLTADPYQLARGYLRAALARGATLLAPVQIDALEIRKRDVIAVAQSGQRIRAREVVFASGYEMPSGFKLRGHRIVSTWALATPPQPRAPWPEECLIWEASEPYLYLRTTPERRVIIGGEDEDFADEAQRDALLPRKTATLLRKLRALFPALTAEADFAWTGSFGTSATGLPSIGPLPGMPRCHAVLGYGGNGITFSMIAAQLLRAALTGQRDPDADLFAFK